MQVAKWGNSLAVRLPKALVDKLVLKPGDEVKVIASEPGTLEVARDDAAARRAEALKRMSELQWPLPPDYKFDRDEANSRG
jgi:antitoxin MazE